MSSIFQYNAPSESQDTSTAASRARTKAPSRAKAFSRASSAKPTTAVLDDTWIVAVLEGRGVNRAVGIAACQQDSANVVCMQINDSQTYVKTVHALQQRYPSSILVPASALPNKGKMGGSVASSDMHASDKGDAILVSCLEEAFEDVEQVAVNRKYWNADDGLDFISQLTVVDEERNPTLTAVKHKYFALSAASALFKYLELKLHTAFPVASARIRYVALEGTMLIDQETVTNLELVQNILDPRSKHSLFGLLNHCSTKMATRLLRNSILSPSVDVATIENRLDTVGELIENEERYHAIRKALAPLASMDCDKLVGSIVMARPHAKAKSGDPAKESERKISLMLQLRSVVKALPALRAALSGSSSSLLCTIAAAFDDERPEMMSDKIDKTIDDAAQGSLAKGPLAARNARAYAIKASARRMLEVARAAYLEAMADLVEMGKQLSEELEYPSLTTVYTGAHGFVFSIDRAEWEAKAVPKGFIGIVKRTKKVQCSSLDLSKRNEKIAQVLEEIFMLSDEIIDELIEDVRADVAALYRINEAISMLDFVASLAKTATSNNYVRPEISPSALAIKAGRHPLHERFQDQGALFQPNDTFMDSATSFQIITGANCSGKSTYIRQVALLTVLAQIGSFIPADYGSFPVFDCLLTRLSNDDAIDQNLSHFALEMRTMASILTSIKLFKKPLVIVDELGRATSPIEGFGLCHAISEEIILSKASCLFATHFRELTRSLASFANVTTLQLQTEVDFERSGMRLIFNHRVADGVTSLVHYGLELAKATGLPAEMLARASEITKQLDAIEESKRTSSKTSKLYARNSAMLKLHVTLQSLLDESTLDNEHLLDLLRYLQQDSLSTLIANLDPSERSAASSTEQPQPTCVKNEDESS